MIYIYNQKIDAVWFAAALEDDKVLATNFGSNESEVLKGLLHTLPFNAKFQMNEKSNQLAETLFKTMKSMLEGEDVSPSFKFDMSHLPNYSRKVLTVLSKLPIGYATSYGALAKATGGGARAVGNVMARNPFAPLIPCHRVVRSDFSLGGYGGGLDLKRDILSRENRGFPEPTKIKVDHAVLEIFPVGFVRKD